MRAVSKPTKSFQNRRPTGRRFLKFFMGLSTARAEDIYCSRNQKDIALIILVTAMTEQAVLV